MNDDIDAPPKPAGQRKSLTTIDENRDLEDVAIDILPGGDDIIPPSVPKLRTAESEAPVPTQYKEDDSMYLPPGIPALKSHSSLPVTGKEAAAAAQRHRGAAAPHALVFASFMISSLRDAFPRLPSQTPTVYCHICMENVPESESHIMVGEPCSHSFCRECLKAHLEIQIREGQVRNPCPMVGQDNCGNFATGQDILDLCSEETVEKFIRFERIKADDNHRECPVCGHLQLGGPRAPAMTCEKCSAAYCFFHSNAHPDERCQDYARRMKIEDRETEKVLRQTSKKCPKCKAATQKNGGCNHMTCQKCRCNWCWLCGRNMGSNYSKHYEWWNVLGCAGAQFQLEEVAAFLPLYRLFTVFLLLISFPTYLGFVILLEIIAVLAVLTCFTKCMTKCSRGRQIKEALAFPFLAAAYPAGLISFIISICLGLSISLVLLLLVLLLILPPVLLARKACNSSKPTNEELRRVVMLPIKIVTTFFKNIN